MKFIDVDLCSYFGLMTTSPPEKQDAAKPLTLVSRVKIQTSLNNETELRGIAPPEAAISRLFVCMTFSTSGPIANCSSHEAFTIGTSVNVRSLHAMATDRLSPEANSSRGVTT
jgi:hypothetical protein